ncbi:UNKNOWN [Stylonychia lemnae]|uniref:DBF4-type domain-containing protein n=1 Tax=Stylonychia lemnae TaxID=5949 RepID=A0A078AQL0_STYLE|nr:UNKNOWN [Stylonychia lemnae]|eukprot:CDW84226.1 UNKNOWN [Stylonychia lemnae]
MSSKKQSKIESSESVQDPMNIQMIHSFELLKLERDQQENQDQNIQQKYDYPKLEYDYYIQNQDEIDKRRKKSIDQERDKICLSEVEGQEFLHQEPMPNANHQYCPVCGDKFKEYYEHIDSKEHKLNVKAQFFYLRNIDDEIAFFDKKNRKIQNDEIDNNQDDEKYQNNDEFEKQQNEMIKEYKENLKVEDQFSTQTSHSHRELELIPFFLFKQPDQQQNQQQVQNQMQQQEIKSNKSITRAALKQINQCRIYEFTEIDN